MLGAVIFPKTSGRSHMGDVQALEQSLAGRTPNRVHTRTHQLILLSLEGAQSCAIPA